MTFSRRLCLAYGSNLSRAQMLSRCPQAQPIAAVTIQGWRLDFFGARSGNWGPGGVASLVADEAGVSCGALYDLTAADEARLDEFEGYPSFYAKREDFAQFIEGAGLAQSDVVFAYLKNDLSFPNPPARAYLETIRQGFSDWDLPLDVLAVIELLTQSASYRPPRKPGGSTGT